MKVKGIEGLSAEQIRAEVQQGGKFVIYLYCFSVVIMSFKRSSDIYFIRPGENAVVKGLPYTLLSAVLGWWGFPWGLLIYTPHTLYTNLRGGKDVTAAVMASMVPAQAANPAAPLDFDLGPQNPW